MKMDVPVNENDSVESKEIILLSVKMRPKISVLNFPN